MTKKATRDGYEMPTRKVLLKVQNKLNGERMEVLGSMLARCGKDDFGMILKKQILCAMSPEFDDLR